MKNHPIPPYINNEDNVPISDIKYICERIVTKNHLKNFLLSAFLFIEKEGGEVGINQLTDSKAAKINGIRKRLNELVNIGAMEKKKRTGKFSPVNVYSFKAANLETIQQLSSTNISEEKPSTSNSATSLLQRNDVMTLSSEFNIVRHRTAIDNFICSVLFGALTTNRCSKETEITTKIDWYGSSVVVNTKVITGESIARIMDLKYYIAALTIADMIVENQKNSGKEASNFFAIETRFINKQMGRASNGGNTESIIKALKRLSSTRFFIPEMPKDIVERLDMDYGSQVIDPISNFGEYHKEIPGSSRTRSIVAFSLTPRVFEGLLSDGVNVFRINPEVLEEENPVIFAYHLFCRRRIGSNTNSYLRFNLKTLNYLVSPSTPYKEFVSLYKHGLLQYYLRPKTSKLKVIEDAEPIIFADGPEVSDNIYAINLSVYGYCTRLQGDSVLIYIDPLDDYVGLSSMSKLIKKQNSLSKSYKKGAVFENADISDFEKRLLKIKN